MGSVIDLVNDVVRGLAVNSAADRLGCPQNLLDDPTELPGHGPGSHHTGSLVDVLDGDVATVLDVLHLLPVPGGFLQSLDDQGGGAGDHGTGGLSVLDLQLYGDLQTFPVLSSFGNIVTNLLG